jgi:hypothetical protein
MYHAVAGTKAISALGQHGVEDHRSDARTPHDRCRSTHDMDVRGELDGGRYLAPIVASRWPMAAP